MEDFNYNESKIEGVEPIVYADEDKEFWKKAFEEKVRENVRLEKEISDKDFEIKCMQERIDYMRKTMNDMVTMVKESK
jgi:hypothetical protein